MLKENCNHRKNVLTNDSIPRQAILAHKSKLQKLTYIKQSMLSRQKLKLTEISVIESMILKLSAGH